MSKKNYRIFEGLRVASCLTFISGYMNAFTFVTQEGRFAGIQSGNVVYLAYYLAKGAFHTSLLFLVPIFFFALGQCITYLARNYCVKRQLPWHLAGSVMMTSLVLLAILLNPFIGPSLTIAILALAASVQIETFRHVRGFPYANVMMTGNVKNAAYLSFKGFVEKDVVMMKRGRNIFLTILSFILGASISTFLSIHYGEFSLIYILLPMFYVNYQLWKEKKSS